LWVEVRGRNGKSRETLATKKGPRIVREAGMGPNRKMQFETGVTSQIYYRL
jgi:hypothetical protein